MELYRKLLHYSSPLEGLEPYGESFQEQRRSNASHWYRDALEYNPGCLILPVTLGYLTRITIIKFKGKETFTEAKPYIKTISIFGLLTIVSIAFGKEGQTLLSKPLLAVETVLPMILFYALGFALMTWVGMKAGFSKQDIIALSYSSLTKNRSMALAIAIVALNPLSVTAIALAGVLAQLPMIIVYGEFVDKILSKHLN